MLLLTQAWRHRCDKGSQDIDRVSDKQRDRRQREGKDKRLTVC